MKIFQSMYEWLLGRPLPLPETLNYRDVIFPNVGLFMLGLTLFMMLFYYYGINNKFNPHRFYHTKYWFLTLFLTAIIVGFGTVYLAQKEGATPHSYITWLALMNSGYSLIAFIIFSFAIKRWSTAYTTPAIWPSKN